MKRLNIARFTTAGLALACMVSICFLINTSAYAEDTSCCSSVACVAEIPALTCVLTSCGAQKETGCTPCHETHNVCDLIFLFCKSGSVSANCCK